MDLNPRPQVRSLVLCPAELRACMVIPAGFEPSITALKGRRPNQLVEGTMSALFPELNIWLCGESDHSVLKYQDIVDPYSEYGCEDNKIIYCRQCCPPLPLVNGLRGAEAEDVLEILHRQSRINPHAGDVDSCCGHINDRYVIHFIYAPFPAQSRKGTGSVGLKVIDRFQYFNNVDALADHVDNVFERLVSHGCFI